MFALPLEVDVDDDFFLPSLSASFLISLRNILEHLPYSQLVASDDMELCGKGQLFLDKDP